MIGGVVPRMIDSIDPQVTKVTINGQQVLYIYCNIGPDLGVYPIKQLGMIKEDIQKTFAKIYPDTIIVVGFFDLKFTSLTKKEEFQARLDGTVQ